MAIDVGPACIDRANTGLVSYTCVCQTNPANATGLITVVQIYAAGVMGNIKVGSFSASGNNLTTRDYVSLADTAVGLNTYNAPTDFSPFEIKTGDYIGIYFTAVGNDIERTLGGGQHLWLYLGDGIPSTSRAFSDTADNEISLYATGIQLGRINIGDVWKPIQNIEINIGDSWKQLCDMEINIGDVWKKGVY